jgi:hypothetical protein
MGIQTKAAGWLTGGLVIATLAAVPAQAQELRVTVPFDFAVGKTVLPAGDYTIDAAPDPALLSLRACDGTAAMFVATVLDDRVQQPETPQLLFVHVGDTYRLELIEMGDDLVRGVPLPAEVHNATADHVAVGLQRSRTRSN